MTLLYDIGVNDADYLVQHFETVLCADGKLKRKVVWRCPFYQAWRCMIVRCHSKQYKIDYPTYKDVTCCEEWLVFSKFKSWMEQQDYVGKQLDKDIISPSSRFYSPETCAFVKGVTNKFIISNGASRGEHPLGVYWSKKAEKFQASCSNPFTKEREHLGLFNCPQEAHEAWRKRKHELAQLVAELETDPRVVEALKKRYSKDEWYSSGVKH